MGRKYRPEDDWPNDDWDDEFEDDWDDDDDYERNRSSRKIRYLFAGLLLFFMWLVYRDKKKAENQ